MLQNYRKYMLNKDFLVLHGLGCLMRAGKFSPRQLKKTK